MQNQFVHTIIGLDCAVRPENTGLALMTKNNYRWLIKDIQKGSSQETPVQIILKWLKDLESPFLLAIDAPLGWPAEMSRFLPQHNAGELLDSDPNLLFRRYTDIFLHKKLGKMPLEIGAERIARTALRALKIIHEVSTLTNKIIPLAWNPAELKHSAAIEVYPAGTLLAHGIPVRGYKNDLPEGPYRLPVLEFTRKHIQSSSQRELISHDTDLLDSVLCCIAGKDFLQNNCSLPPDEKKGQAKKEGWIWFYSHE